ncbi:MAG: hypothetical protein JW791_04060 [Nanoarchaeota archaeon]|nr:hypothetical protein [Nanoarchaeota archaeon]
MAKKEDNRSLVVSSFKVVSLSAAFYLVENLLGNFEWYFRFLILGIVFVLINAFLEGFSLK